MQDAIRRAAGRGDGRDGVFERCFGDDLSRPEVLFEQPHHQPPGLLGDVVLLRIQRRHIVEAGWTDAEKLDRGGHGVGGELAAARTSTGARVFLNFPQVRHAHLAGRYRPDRLKHILERDVMAAVATWANRPAVEREPGKIEPGQRHDRGRDRLVAAHDQDEPVEEVSARNELDRVGNHLPADERGLHAFGPHRDTVGNRDGIELHRRSTGGANPSLDAFRQAAVIEVTRHGLDPAVPDTDERFGEVFTSEADRPQHRSRGRPVVAFGQTRALALQRGCAIRIGHRKFEDSSLYG